jgi:hypothetical protein
MLVRPRDSETEAVEVLRHIVEERFREGTKLLSADEWARLAGQQPAPWADRLQLLLRLAVTGGTRVSWSVDGRTESVVPNNLTLERIAGLYAALPDGTPFRIRLLLEGQKQQGKRSADRDLADHPWVGLDLEKQKLPILREALRLEEAEVARGASEGQPVRIRSFEELCPLLQQAAEKVLGRDFPMPLFEHVKSLWDAVARKGLTAQFLLQRARLARYRELYVP